MSASRGTCWSACVSSLSLLLLLVLSPGGVDSAVSSVSDLLSLYASRSVSFPSHRDISAVHVLDAYVVYDGSDMVDGGGLRAGASGSGGGHSFHTDGLQPLSHFHPMSSHQFRTLSADTGLPRYSHTRSPSGTTSMTGSYQPFPSSVVLSFSAFGLDFHLPLSRVPSLFVANASVVVRDGWDTELSRVEPLDSSYWALDGDYLDDNWAVATLREDGRFHAVIAHEGEVYQADPIEHFKPHMADNHFHTLATASQRGMAIYRHRDLINQQDKRCGADKPSHEQEMDTDTAMDGQHTATHNIATNTSGSASGRGGRSSGRRLLQLAVNDEEPTAPNLVGMHVFSIFPNNPQRMPYQFVVDAGFYSLFDSQEDIQAAVAAVVTASNIILLKQTQLFIQINGITIMQQPNPAGGPNPWNQASYPAGSHACPNYNLNSQLEDMNNYRQNHHPNQGAAHHLFTNCWPAPGTVGISYIGWTCSAPYAISVSSYNSPFWQTVVHEIGHTLGASHTIGAVSNTPVAMEGGIMDYYVDSRYPIGTGPYQFSPINEAELQYWVGENFELPDFSTFTQPYCMKPYVAVCGNGVVEPGEQCDDSTGCCTSTCKLASGAQCSGTSTCCTAQCQYAPSSVGCGAGNGFCANGICQLSSCPATLPYCGLDTSTGGCRQSCSGAGLCSSTAWSFNLNLPDGTVCNSQGGTCSAGQCATSDPTATNTITYAWTTGAWSTSCPCTTATLTRSVSCVGTSGATSTVYSDSYCLATGVAQPATAQSCTIPSSCYPYSWQYSDWSSCSQSCDSGVQSRTATCYWESSPPVPVASSYCSSTAASALTQTCNTATCSYQYVESNTFSSCTASCGGGTQTRTPATTCARYINAAWQSMPLSSCVAVLGYTVSDTQSCNTQACDTYAWQYGGWSTCSVACGGGGVSTRSAVCMDVTTGTAASTSACSALGSPITSESCGSAACPAYEWIYSAWSTCSATCGGGVSTRTATCYDSVYQQWYDASTCTAALGSAVTSSACNSQACPTTTYEWQWSAWGACPVICGGGNQTRQVACVSLQPYMPVAASNCVSSTKPATSQACGQKSCNIYSWSITAWSACSAECGGGTQTRAVYCQNFWTGALSAPSTCSQYMSSPQPASSQACNTAACPHMLGPTPIDGINGSSSSPTTDVWRVGEWSGCSVECGGGEQYRSVECGTNQTDVCDATPSPVSAQSCNTQACPAVWQTSSWSSCSAQCGGGWMNRSVECVGLDSGSSMVVVDPSRCSHLTRPSELGDCNFAPCPSWSYSDWSPCTAVCGVGSTSRTATCTRYDGVALSVSECSPVTLESTVGVCHSQPCPHWHLQSWSDCDKPCGTGAQSRTRTCRLPHTVEYEGRMVAEQQCVELSNTSIRLAVDGPGAARDEQLSAAIPPTTRTCNVQSCPVYYWAAVASDVCSRPCGGGVELLSVGCYSGVTGDRVDEARCPRDARPSNERPCNVQSCDGPQWHASDFSTCSAVCGSGEQYRNVSCRTSEGRLMDDTYCSLQSMPALSQSCSVSARVCWGVDERTVVAGEAVNGVCSLDTRTCMCRPGYTGQYCEQAPNIWQVSSSVTTVVAGDRLLIEWASTGDISYVSLSLARRTTTFHTSHDINRTSPDLDYYYDGQYLAVDIPNSGEWEWSVPYSLPPATDYTVRVSYSAQVYADSAAVSVMDSACGYVECGEHGTCRHGQCQCEYGWSGSDCSTSPCDELRCNWEHAVECNALSWLTGSPSYSTAGQQCSCLDGWSGPLCATPPSCASELQCRHGGDTDLSTVFVSYSNETTAQYCGRCKCQGRWQGATCSVCPITCAAGGVVDDNCTRCDCPDGFYGAACQSRYYQLNMTLQDMPVPHYQLANDSQSALSEASEAWLRRLEQSAALELAAAAGFASLSSLVSVAVTARAVQPSRVQLSTRFSFTPVLLGSYNVGTLRAALDSTGEYGAVATANSAVINAYKRLPAVKQSNQTAARTLLGAYTLLVEMMGDADSIVYRGDVLSHLSVAAGLEVVDPTGMDSAALAALPVYAPTSRFVASAALIASSHSTGSTSSSSGASGAASGSSEYSLPSSSTSRPAAGVVAAVVLAAAVLVGVAGCAVWCARERSKLSCLACPQLVPSHTLLQRSISAPPATHPAPAALPEAEELEMVQSASSDMPELDYYQRSISDSSVAYQQCQSPEPKGNGYAMHDEDDEQLPIGNGLRRTLSMDELPSPPSLSPQISSA